MTAKEPQNGLKQNAEVEMKTVHVPFCDKCWEPLFMCKRCGRAFDQFEKISCDEGHRCEACIKRSRIVEQ